MIYHNDKNTIFFKKCIKKIFFFKISIIMPDSSLKMLWDFIILVLLFFNVFYIPMKIAFQVDQMLSNMVKNLIDIVPNYIFFIDMIFSFNTGYYSKGIIQTSRISIIKHYLRGLFIWDFLSIIPLFYQIFGKK